MGGGAEAVVWGVAVMLSNDLWGVMGIVNAGARGMAGQTTSSGIASPATIIAALQLLTSKAAGQQIRGIMETTPGGMVSGWIK